MEIVFRTPTGDWVFDGERTYYLIDGSGKKTAKLYQEYVPDPMKLWQSKAQAAGVEMESDAGMQLRPSPMIYKLWEHKNANINN